MSESTPAMPRYKCHKEVSALQIKEVKQRNATKEFPGGSHELIFENSPSIQVTDFWYRKFGPAAGGYYVVYADGYASYSPQKAFEEGYSLIAQA